MLDSIQKLVHQEEDSCQDHSFDNGYHSDYMRLYIANVVLT